MTSHKRQERRLILFRSPAGGRLFRGAWFIAIVLLFVVVAKPQGVETTARIVSEIRHFNNRSRAETQPLTILVVISVAVQYYPFITQTPCPGPG